MSSKLKRTCAFFTFGCKVNQYETQLLREELKDNGFSETQDEPSFFIVNGCTVTEAADKKCRNLVKNIQKKNPGSKIILTGCYAQHYTQKYANGVRQILVIPQDHKQDVIKYLKGKFKSALYRQSKSKSGLVNCGQRKRIIHDFSGHSRAFVKIQDGCNNFCSYCIVPLMRHKPRSRKESDIVQEISILTSKGFKEIVLCGINLGTWGEDFKPRKKISSLIKRLNAISGLQRLRLSSIELQHVDEGLIDAFAKSDKLCRHLHIPLQSGDDEILKKMNRNYTAEEYLQKLNSIRQRYNRMSFTTDVMVGFPGETDQQFNNTLKTIKAGWFSRIHVFPYSIRPGTKAADIQNKISVKIKKVRRDIVEAVARDLSFKFRKRFLNKKVRVLFEEKKNGYWCGYSDEYIYMNLVSNENLKNRIKTVKVGNVSITSTIAAG